MQNLAWSSLKQLGSFDSARRFTAKHPVAVAYIAEGGYRTPSRAWPHSRSKPLLTAKFAKWVATHHADFAKNLG